MLSPSSSTGSVRHTGRRRALVHPGVRIPFPDAHGFRPQELRDAGYSKLSHPTTMQQAVEQISYLVKNEIKQFDELASTVKNTYGVSLTYAKPHVGLGSMLGNGNVSQDVPHGQELPTASDSLFQFPRDPLDGGTDSSLLIPFSAAKRLGRYGSWYRAQNRKITVPPPMPKPNHSESKRDLNSDTQCFDDATNEHRPTHITNSDHLSAMLFDIPDPDISLSSSAANESYSENLYDWLQTQGTQTQSNARNDYAHHTPTSPQACSTTGDTPISHRRALNGGFADHRSSQHSRPLSPPSTIRLRKTRFQALPSASGSPRLEGSQDEFASTAGLGLLLPSHLDHVAGVSSLEDSRAANTEAFSSPPQIETKGRQQHLSDGLPDVAPSQSEDHADRPLPTVLAHFMHVIAELKLKSTEGGADGTSPLSAKAGPWAVPSESLSDCGLPSDIADGVEGDRESVKKLAKRLLEQGLSQEEQSQKLRILAETLCEIALLRRTLSGMLSSKYETEQ